MKKIVNLDTLLGIKLNVQLVGEGPWFCDYIFELEKNFSKMGCICSRNEKEIDCSEKWDVIFIVSPNVSRHKKSLQYLKTKKTAIVCALLTEQPYSREIGFLNIGKGMVKRDRTLLKYFDLVFVWSFEQYLCYQKYHKRVYHFPYTYIEKNDYTKKYGGTDNKKYDILYIGTRHSKHRNDVLDSLIKRYNVAFDEIWGEEKYKAINEAKICINIHQEPSLVMECPRFFDFASNKAFILSEAIQWPEPFVIGEDFDCFYWNNIFEKIDGYLENDNARNQIANNLYNKVTKMKMENQFYIIMNAIYMEMNYRYNITLDSFIKRKGRIIKYKLYNMSFAKKE